MAVKLTGYFRVHSALLKLTASEMQDESGSMSDASSLDQALKTLHQAEKTVAEVVAQKFDEAVQAEDLASIERFFKIFPLINLHDIGLEKFTVYLREKVRLEGHDFVRSRANIHPGLLFVVASNVPNEPQASH